MPNSEGGYGKLLGNSRNSRLAGYLKIKLLKDGLRVAYGLVRDKEVVTIIVISDRLLAVCLGEVLDTVQ